MSPLERDTTIVVLGCRPGADGELAGAAGRRAARAVACFHELDGRAKVVCSGGRAWDGVVEADAFARALVALGIPAGRISRERCSMTTLDNARYTAAHCARVHAEGPGANSSLEVWLVTCEWHMPRAEKYFRVAGLAVVPAPAEVPPGRLPRAFTGRLHALRERAAAWLDEVAR